MSILVAIAFLSFTADTAWELKKDKNGIQIFTRRSSDSDIKEFKAIRTLPGVKLSSFVAFIKDEKVIPEWNKDVSYTRLVGEKKDKSWNVYFKLDMPWPFDDRDFVLNHELVQNEATKEITITMKSKSSLVEKDDDLVRMEVVEGTWKLKPLDNGDLQITQQFLGDPAGSLPSWVVNMFIVDGPYNSFLMIEEILKRPKYTDAGLGYIID